MCTFSCFTESLHPPLWTSLQSQQCQPESLLQPSQHIIATCSLVTTRIDAIRVLHVSPIVPAVHAHAIPSLNRLLKCFQAVSLKVELHNHQLFIEHQTGMGVTREITRLASLGMYHTGDWFNAMPSPALGLHLPLCSAL